MPLPQQPSNPDVAPPSAGNPPPGGPPAGGPPGQGGDAGQEVIQAIKVLTLFAQAQKQQGNEGPAQAMQMLMHSLSGQEQESPMEQKMPNEEPDKGQMPMNSAKGATPVM